MKKVSLILLVTVFLSCTLFKKTAPTFMPEMVLIPGGTYTIGDVFENANSDALPAHEVSLPDFYIGKFEVTFAQYDAFAKITGRKLPDDQGNGRTDRAVVYVTWDDAHAFCDYLGMRLPSETEWEYAARSGGKRQLYAGTNDPDSLMFYAFTRESDINFSVTVGQKKPNDLGLYDMSGNVFEWIGEFYQFYQMPEKLHDNNADAIRIIRGGSFGETKSTTRTYWRAGTLREVEANDIGFRCARSR